MSEVTVIVSCTCLHIYSLSESGTRNLGPGGGGSDRNCIYYYYYYYYDGEHIFTTLKFLKQCSLVVMINVGWKRCQAFGREWEVDCWESVVE